MRLTHGQRGWLFWAYLAVAIADFALLCFVVVYSMIGDASTWKVVTAVLGSGSVFVVMLYHFRDFVAQAFSEQRPEELFSHYFRSRLDAGAAGNVSQYFRLNGARVLEISERILQEWFGPAHFELSVFADPDTPRIICYFDSGNQTIPASHSKRQQQDNYYIEHKYEVVELLRAPSSSVKFIPKTRSSDANYSFASREQERDIGSSMLFCYDHDAPRAVVVTCSKSGVFTGDDTRIDVLIKAIGLGLRGEEGIVQLLNRVTGDGTGANIEPLVNGATR